MTGTICDRCGDPLVTTVVSGPWLCGRCRRGLNAFDFCRSFAIYQGVVRNALHHFKYGGKHRLGSRLAEFLIHTWINAAPFHEVEIIMPVPLHRRRERQRGFNQSSVLAKYLSRFTRRTLELRLLKRNRSTPSQTGLTLRQRRLNVSSAFEVRRPHLIRGKVALVIDDVFTTGATLNEVARVLKEAGARKVLAMTVARVSPQWAILGS